MTLVSDFHSSWDIESTQFLTVTFTSITLIIVLWVSLAISPDSKYVVSVSGNDSPYNDVQSKSYSFLKWEED